jgi:hypothetical protein
MWYGHELSQHELTKDCMVGRAEVRDLECQVLSIEVLLCANGDR